MSAEREAALRRIAIVISSLPAAVAARLLGELDPNAKQLVRRTMTSLADVDPIERNRALQAFAGSLQNPTSKSTTADEIVLTSVSRGTPSSGYRTADAYSHTELPQTDHPSLTFLSDVQDDVLVRLVIGEHPQTVALVLASIAPAQAARLLPRLDPRLRNDALGRVGRLGEIPVDVIEDVSRHLRSRVAHDVPARVAASTPAGQRRLDAILAALPSETDSMPSEAVDEFVTSTLRVAPETITPPAAAIFAPRREEALPWSTDDINAYLVELSPIELREALASVDTRDALLALCGLPSETAESVIATLPRAQGREIRTQIVSIGAVQLREIDQAKERVAIAALPPEAREEIAHLVPHAMPLAA